jgi:aspartyl-tRNA(Asn)/glutamyl-tRNA(Gln) amidotransferase subunit A
MSNTDLHYLSVAEAAAEIAAKRLSPVELTQAYLDRIAAINPTINAYITVTADSALAQAKQAEAEIIRGEYKGPFHGMPIALKDLFDTKGIRTTGGSKVMADHVPSEDGVVVSRLAEAGAVLLGKLNMHEFAFGITNVNPHYGSARNAWNTDRITGGSSGGSGTATAAGLCAAALGSDTGGSIRIPACFCGIVGLKPTYGRVSKRGVLPLSMSLDHVGPLTRTAEDAALMLQVIAGYDAQDPGSTDVAVPSYTTDLGKGIKGMRIGVLRGSYVLPMDADIERALADSISTLKDLGAVVTDPVELPYIEDALPANITIISSEAASFHQANMDDRPGDYGEDVFGRLSIGRDHPATAYIAARNTQHRVQEQLLDSLANFDAVMLPMMPLGAPPIGQNDVSVGGKTLDVRAAVTRYTQPFNLTGFPAISVPCGFTDDGLPIGFQLAAKPFEEASLLRLAHAYEGVTEWSQQRPPVG